ncbi:MULTISPECIES: inositol monophosphatase family protein [unclassified Acidiphilium]|uniref:inositol monophosphatase family protein n=1 Tax=unclassified Acidiphilium TaxID=2617493 RepID=UPI00021456C8|nr:MULTISPECIES: inositol monophosphatase family protein [unclassified Acidiphilium]EGO95319.1 Inositol-phosphate phosphatase [Acidiphilium sp. PM]
MTPRRSAHMTIMVAAAQKAARRLVRDFNEVEHLQVSVKGPSDFVSQADMRAEQTIREELERARPGYAFLMEESGAHGSENWAWRWIVDPLDGTTNFLHAIPNWAISIALEKRLPEGGSEIVAGMVMAPALDELFWAEKGAGAYLNDRRLRVSSRRDWSSALFATGIPFARTAPRNRLAFARVLGALMPETAGVRRMGSASLDLAWTAAGRYDGYWELGTHLWDIAAGALMVREAGGYATAPDGGDALSGDIVAGNPHIHPRLRELVGSALETAKT